MHAPESLNQCPEVCPSLDILSYQSAKLVWKLNDGLSAEGQQDDRIRISRVPHQTHLLF